MFDLNAYSVYSLISELCVKLVNEKSYKKHPVSPDVRKLRSKAFEILLKRNKYKIDIKDNIDPLKELDIIHFATKIKAKNNYRTSNNFEKFEQILSYIYNDEYFLSGSGKSVLVFLLFVKDFLKCSQNEDDQRQHLLVPGPFTLYLEYSRSLNYPFKAIKYNSNQLEHFKGLASIIDCNNPYLPEFVFEKANNYAKSEGIKPFKLQLEEKYETPVSYKYLKPFTLRLSSIENQQYLEEYPLENNEEICRENSNLNKRFGWNWEDLGKTTIQNETKFGSELEISMPLEILIDENLNSIFEAKIINVNTFLSNLKSLLVGIESESFFLDKNITFYMVENLTIANVVPNIMLNFVQECLDCGTSYRRMQILSSRKNFQQNLDGFIFKALCGAIEDYLLMFRQYVFSYEDSKILEFCGRTGKIIKQMLALSYILTIHPKVSENCKPPSGSHFLGYIYKEIMRVTQSDMLALLIFFLKRCCHVYFKNLQKWIFLGSLEDRFNELFICFADQYHPNTKYYFDKAFFIKKEAVPGFFLGYEEYILQCGKYTMLLKAFNPNHPIFSLQYPPVAVCLSFEELRKVQEACEIYERRALELCESPVTVQDIFKKDIETKRNFFKLVLEKSKKNLENWKLEKKQLSNDDICRKKKVFEELSLQIEQKRIYKIQEKMEDIVMERELIRNQEYHSDQINLIEQQETLKRISCFEEIKEMTENKKHCITSQKLGPTDFKTFEENKFEAEIKVCNLSNEKLEQYQHLNFNKNLKNSFNDVDIANSNEIIGKESPDINELLTTKTDIENKNLTEAQKNKIKVLGSEYNIFGTYLEDVNSNFHSKCMQPNFSELNDLQKNKMKSMQSNCFQTRSNSRANLDIKTESLLNKKKVLENEYFIAVGSFITPANISPMSTSSDLSLEASEVTKNKNISKTDMECMIFNQNIENVDLENECQLKQNFLDDCFIAQDDLTKKNEYAYNDESYARSLELIKNNFKCEPKTGFIHLKDIFPRFEKSNGNTNFEDILTKQVDLNSLSVITLTEFLQKSIVLPLRVHLKIVNNEVMRVFLVNLDLINHFSSLRNYFFLMDGEFSSIICDELINKLEKGASPVEIFNYQTLHSVLDKAIGSSHCSDKNSSKLSFIVSDLPEQFDLTSPSVLSNLCLSYKIDWPLNLILSPETLDKYGDIFKYLFKVRRISWVLEQSYRIMKESAKLIGKELLISPQYRRVQLIRHKFFHFIHALRNHITASALQASWKEFQDELLKAKCIEEIYRKHTNYIKKILFLCMLNKSSIDFNKAMESIFKITLRFYRNLKSKEWKRKIGENYYIHPRFEKLLIDEKEFEKLVKYVIYLGNKIVKRGYQEEIGEFLRLVNYNQYYVTVNSTR
ncbi:uncharacterized protein LOC129607613 isoform X2 [Condylostylus longicornis]|uniref:uncharacterized protein LOC129607613 isoform X2 n=1 Tax=Condylostylus longicornis TaxID=2530218 RepID=UPI00244D9C6F|nr:uncharacterized protein LOC129607613 isoform X2 [Condylostylus longicornis]